MTTKSPSRRPEMRMLLGGLAILWLALAVALPAAAADWPCWRGPDHNGWSAETDWSRDWSPQGPPLLWEAQIGVGFAAVVVSDGRAYALGNRNDEDILWCFDAATGRELWRRHYPSPLSARNYEGGPNASPLVYQGKVYTFTKSGELFCFDAATGDERWHVKLADQLNAAAPTWGFASSPIAVNGAIVVNAGLWGCAVDPDTGAVVWSSGRGTAGYASAVPHDFNGAPGMFMFTGAGLAAVNAAGERLWLHEWETRHNVNAADPIVLNDQVFISSGYGKGCALLSFDAKTAEELWSNRNLRSQFSAVVYRAGHFYGFDESALTCLDAADGSVVWAQRGLGKGALLGAGAYLVVLGERGQLVVTPASPQGYAPVAETQVLTGRCWTMPVLAHGLLYVRNAAAHLKCLDLRPPDPQQ